MNATLALDKIVKLLGLRFKKESFFTTILEDGKTEVTNNADGDLQVGQTLYVLGEATLQPAPAGVHTTREGLVLTLDEESTIVKIEVTTAEAEVERNQEEVESSKVKMTIAEDAQGQKLESPTFDVGEEVYVLGPDGEKTLVPNGEHQVVLKDSSGNENKIRIQTVDGKIVQRENVEQMAEEEMAEFPWDECILKMAEEGYSEETAAKICGSIKAKNMTKAKMSTDLYFEQVAQVEKLKDGISQLLSLVETINGKFKTELSELKSEFNTFKNSPERKPVDKKVDYKEKFEDFRVSILKDLRK
jgi:hypothetical protein